MTLPVRIEAKAWTDSRYATVALYLGLSAGDAEIALIRCAAIWRWQTEHYTEDAPTYVVPEGVVIGALKSLEAPRALVAAGLAELADGGLRIKGGKDDKGNSRIDWYWRDQQQRRAAGAASADRRKKAGDPRTPDGRLAPLPADAPTGDQRRTNGGPTADQRDAERPPSSPDSDLRTQDLDLSLTASRGEVEVPPPAADSAMRVLLEHAIDRINAARAAVDPAAPPLPPIAGQPGSALLDHLRPLPPDRRLPTLDHAIDVMVATLRVEGKPVGEYRLAMLAGDRAWHRWCAGTVGGAARGARQAARGDPPPGTGYGRPAAHHDTGTIDPRTIKPRKP